MVSGWQRWATVIWLWTTPGPFYQEVEWKYREWTLVTFAQDPRSGSRDSDWTTFIPMIARKKQNLKNLVTDKTQAKGKRTGENWIQLNPKLLAWETEWKENAVGAWWYPNGISVLETVVLRCSGTCMWTCPVGGWHYRIWSQERGQGQQYKCRGHQNTVTKVIGMPE